MAAFRLGDAWFGLPIDHVLQALDGVRVTALPNARTARPHLPGLLSFEEALLPVLDLALLRGIHRPAPDDAPLVVAQAGPGHRLALQVDELGPVFDVAPDALQPVPGSTERLVQGRGRHMLTLIDARVLWQATSDKPLPALAG